MHQEKIDQLLSLGLEGLDSVKARNVLQNYNWNVEAAANNLLSGLVENQQDDSEPPPLIDLTVDVSMPPPAPSPPSRNSEEAPLQESSQEPQSVNGVYDPAGNTVAPDKTPSQSSFLTTLQADAVASTTSTLHPSTRDDPEQQWALVPLAGPQPSPEISDIDKAIQASLNETYLKVPQYTELIASERIRAPNGPVALRLTRPIQTDALILQALYAVPQIRQAVLGFEPVSQQAPTGDSYWKGTEVYPAPDDWRSNAAVTYVHRLQRLFYYMALTERGYLNVDSTVNFMEQLDDMGHRAGVSSRYRVLDVISRAVANLTANSPPSAQRRILRSLLGGDDNLEVDVITLNPTPQYNALFPCLAQSILPRSFNELAEVIVFEIDRTKAEADRSGKSQREPFTYPSEIFLDQFMASHESRAKERMDKHRSAEEEVQRLSARKRELLSPNNIDSLRSLRTTLTYLNNHAKSDEEARQTSLEELKQRLGVIALRIDAEVRAVDAGITRAQTVMSETFAVSGPQHQEYMLRAVIIDDGQYGRTHTFAYVADHLGQWHKVTDHEVYPTEIEWVLRDTSGLHLGAGPSMLFYSRATVAEQQELLPSELNRDPYKTQVRSDNERFAEELREAGRGATSPNYGVSTPTEKQSDEEQGKLETKREQTVPMDIDLAPPGSIRIA